MRYFAMKKMNAMKKMLFLSAATLVVSGLAAQVSSITPVLIGSTGNFSINGGMMLSSSVGEPMVTTEINGAYILTQGFQQPSGSSVLALNANLVYTNISCAGANDGTANVTPVGGAAPYSYAWSNDPNDTLATNDSLAPGTYTVTITDAGGLTATQIFTVADGSGICGIHVYSGLTPNGDGHNDTWIIDYLELFQPNTVMIYNRWGMLIWMGENYDNQSVIWTGTATDGNPLPDGTYFYTIEIGTASMKGWVELSH